jgi:hypothetical protein
MSFQLLECAIQQWIKRRVTVIRVGFVYGRHVVLRIWRWSKRVARCWIQEARARTTTLLTRRDKIHSS